MELKTPEPDELFGDAELESMVRTMNERAAADPRSLTGYEAMILKLYARVDNLTKNCVPISEDGKSVFINGPGAIELDYGNRRLDRAKEAEARVTQLLSGRGALLLTLIDAAAMLRVYMRGAHKQGPNASTHGQAMTVLKALDEAVAAFRLTSITTPEDKP